MFKNIFVVCVLVLGVASCSGPTVQMYAKEKPQQGLVIAVGPGKFDEDGERMPMDVKVGDKVLFGKWGATEVKLDGVEVLVLKQDDIIGILTA